MRRLIAHRLRALTRGNEIDNELDDEMRLHIEMEAEELVRQGVPPEEALRLARVSFGGVGRHAEAHRDARGVRWMEELWQDLRFAARALRRTPAYTLAAIAVLALGIGASVAVFSAVDAVLLTRLPYPDDERIVRVFQQNSLTNRWSLSVVDFRALQAHSRTLEAVGVIQPRTVAVVAGDQAENVGCAFLSSGIFRALGIGPMVGRVIQPADEEVGAPPVTVLAHDFAVRAFGGAAAALGQDLTIDGVSHTVVGVLSPEVTRRGALAAPVFPALQLRPPPRRGPFGYAVLGKLAKGVTLEQSRRELAGISERIFPEWESSFQDREAKLTPFSFREAQLQDAPRSLAILGGAVGLVLLIAVANVASLSLVRATGRWREVALRTVLGATRERLVRLLLTESLVLALAGAVGGILLAVLGLKVLEVVATGIPRIDQAEMDLRAIAVGLGIGLLAALVIGAYPLAMLLKRDAGESLRDGERTIGAGRRTQALRAAFVVAEFALALPLLAGAALLLNSFVRLQRVDPGFEPSRLLTAAISLPSARYEGDSVIAPYWTRAVARVREIPGVREVGLADAVPPYSPNMNINNFDLVDKPVPPGGAQPTTAWPTITPEYFTALGIPLLEGRMFQPTDTAGVPSVVLVSRSWARHYFPEGNVVGRKLISGGCTTCPFTTVIGVVGDVKYLGLEQSADAVYSPLTEGWSRDLVLFVRTNGDPDQLVQRVSTTLRSLDPGVPVDDISTVEDQLYASLATPRHWTAILGGFAISAVLLAAIGIFGMLSYTVRARRREIGVRMALGARAATIVGMIVRRGLGHAVLGLGLGVAATLLGTRWLSGVLYDVSTTDPPTLAAVTLLLLSVALIACLLPARRAAGIDPVEAIRAE